MEADLVGHAYESAQGEGVHLLHDTAAVDFDGFFTHPQGSRDLFVRHPGDHQSQDLTLSRRQGLQSLIQDMLLFMVVLVLPRVVQGSIHRFEQDFITALYGHSDHRRAK